MWLALGRSPHLNLFNIYLFHDLIFSAIVASYSNRSRWLAVEWATHSQPYFFLWRLLKQASLFLRSPFSLSPLQHSSLSSIPIWNIYIPWYRTVLQLCYWTVLSMLKTASVFTGAVRINKLILRLWMLQGRKRSCKCVLQTKLRSGVKCFPLPTANSHSPTSPHCQSSFLRSVTGELERFPGRYMPTNHYLC